MRPGSVALACLLSFVTAAEGAPRLSWQLGGEGGSVFFTSALGASTTFGPMVRLDRVTLRLGATASVFTLSDGRSGTLVLGAVGFEASVALVPAIAIGAAARAGGGGQLVKDDATRPLAWASVTLLPLIYRPEGDQIELAATWTIHGFVPGFGPLLLNPTLHQSLLSVPLTFGVQVTIFI